MHNVSAQNVKDVRCTLGVGQLELHMDQDHCAAARQLAGAVSSLCGVSFELTS